MARSYNDIARLVGIDYCRGIDARGFYCAIDESDHRSGRVVVDGRRATVHFADQRFSYPGVHRFLKMAAVARDPSINLELPWRRVWRQNVAVQELAKAARIRIPREVLDFDKAFVRASVAQLDNSVPDRKRAFDWSRR